MRPLPFLPRHLLPKREPFLLLLLRLRLLLLPHLLLSPPVTPFTVLSQAVKDGSSLVVTPSSIPTSTTCGPNADLSFEGSKDVLEDPDDEPAIKKRISDFDEEESVDSETEFMGMCLFAPPFFAKFLPPSFCYLPLCSYIFVSPPLLWSPFILYAHSCGCKDL